VLGNFHFENLKMMTTAIRLFADSGSGNKGMPFYTVVCGAEGLESGKAAAKSVMAADPCVHAAASTPVQRLGVILAHLTRPSQPSPIRRSCRPAHRPFRGLLGVSR
jgi:hypothetical protein